MTKYDLLNEPLIATTPLGILSLPGVLAALSRDGVDGFPALRPHQGPAWHMFLVQLAALALHRAGQPTPPVGEAAWTELLRGLTRDFSGDEPWHLVVEDESKPAFLQPPVPKGTKWSGEVATADGLDLLITAKNHDLKQAIARRGEPQDWLFALVSLQTGGTYSKAGRSNNYWSAVRTGNIYAPRVLFGFAPVPLGEQTSMSPRLGSWFRRDTVSLLEQRSQTLATFSYLGYPETGGLGLTWLAPWPEGEQIQPQQLDIWFIESCRRIRFKITNSILTAHKSGTTKSHINALHFNGNIGDPWTPVNKKNEGRGFSPHENSFGYREITKVVFGERNGVIDAHNWNLPVLAQTSDFDRDRETLLLVMQGIAGERQKTGTLGFKSRTLPVGGKIARAWGPRRQELHELAQAQMEEISVFDQALAGALALVAAGGDRDKRKKAHYERAVEARARLDRAADGIFFEHLWARFSALGDAAALQASRQTFLQALWQSTQDIFATALPVIPCPTLLRPRAEARARRGLNASVRKQFPEIFPHNPMEEADNVA